MRVYIAIYNHICIYIAIYVTIYRYILYFRCLDLCFGCLDLYLAIWTCIWMSGLVFVRLDLYFGCQPTTPWSMCLPQAFLLFNQKHAPGWGEHAFCGLCDL